MMTSRRGRRRWVAPEVVQTSAMDCGPAALKCMLDGHGIPVSYGRLREACQTSVDGTSIDTIEQVANRLGLSAEQVMLPLDHLFLASAKTLPALVVVRQPDGGTHFVVAWRRLGPWLQVMDPASGRRWTRCERFAEDVYRHETSVPAAAWRDWAASADFLAPLRERLALLGAAPREVEPLIDRALADDGWFSLGALDAVTRLIGSVVAAGGVRAGSQAVRLLSALFDDTCHSTADIFRLIPTAYWMVVPDPDSPDRARQRLLLRGAVLLRVAGRGSEPTGEAEPLPEELAAALAEKPVNPLRAIWGMLKADGMLRPLAVGAAMAIAAGVLMVEALLFRGLFDIGALLVLPEQRLAAALALLAFLGLLLLIELPIVTESMRFGRHLETRLRMALLRKLPRLPDRYFHSRPVSDMAERGHAIQATRLVPGMAIHFVQLAFELALTVIGIVLLAPATAGPALALAVAAIGIPAVLQPLVNERDLRVRSYTGALGSFYLDALVGLVPVRAHRAGRAVQRQHDGLLVSWTRAVRDLLGLSVFTEAVNGLVCLSLSAWLLFGHFAHIDDVTGIELLLVYWTLKLPAIGSGITSLAHQYPMQRNVLLRLMEPLHAPEDPVASSPAPAVHGPAAVAIRNGAVTAGGHRILSDLHLTIAPGEHIAIVGSSGAGKSTLLGLLLGWHRLVEGSLLVDGAPLTAERLEALRQGTAWIDPAVQLWNRSLMDNLGYSSADGGGTRIGSAIADAGLRGVLRSLPDGLQTCLGEGGGLLSGGEGQRVRLGRGLTQQGVRLALLDEPFRGLDRDRRRRLLADARARWRDVTLLCVTHDVSETLDFSRVLVIEDGRIVEDDVPANLVAARTRYAVLLQAERDLHTRMWGDAAWRRVTIREGQAHENG